LEDLVVDGRMILKLIWKKYGDGVVWTGPMWYQDDY
jgi:hypothetical protein